VAETRWAFRLQVTRVASNFVKDVGSKMEAELADEVRRHGLSRPYRSQGCSGGQDDGRRSRRAMKQRLHEEIVVLARQAMGSRIAGAGGGAAMCARRPTVMQWIRDIACVRLCGFHRPCRSVPGGRRGGGGDRAAGSAGARVRWRGGAAGGPAGGARAPARHDDELSW
jgi:hypothetical protein